MKAATSSETVESPNDVHGFARPTQKKLGKLYNCGSLRNNDLCVFV